MMQVVVISLVQSRDRRDYIEKHFQQIGVEFNFLNAVDPNVAEKNVLDQFSRELFRSRYGRAAIVGEVGNALSHRLAYKEFLNETAADVLMVCEDDVALKIDAKQLLQVLNTFKKSNCDILNMGFSKCDNTYEDYTNLTNPILKISSIGDFAIFGRRYMQSTSGSVCYLVKREAAHRLCRIQPIFALSDDWAYYHEVGFDICYTNPMLARENIYDLESTCGHNNIEQEIQRTDNKIFKALIFVKRYITGRFRYFLSYVNYFRRIL